MTLRLPFPGAIPTTVEQTDNNRLPDFNTWCPWRLACHSRLRRSRIKLSCVIGDLFIVLYFNEQKIRFFVENEQVTVRIAGIDCGQYIPPSTKDVL